MVEIRFELRSRRRSVCCMLSSVGVVLFCSRRSQCEKTRDRAFGRGAGRRGRGAGGRVQDVSRPRWAPSRPCCSGRALPADASTPQKTRSAPVVDRLARLPRTFPRLPRLRSLALDSACACAPRKTVSRPPSPARRNPLCRRCPPNLRITAGLYTFSSIPLNVSSPRDTFLLSSRMPKLTIDLFTVYCCYRIASESVA